MNRPLLVEVDLKSPVWRMQIDEQENILCLETRDAADKSTAFTSVDIETGEAYFKNKTLPHGWQCGLDAVAFGMMLVHGYQSELLPVRKGLTAVDARTGETIWENHNLNLEQVDEARLLVYDTCIQPKKVHLIDARTQQHLTVSNLTGSQSKSDIKYPEPMTDADLVALYIPDISQANTALFLKHNSYRIVSLHALSAGVVNQYLYVLDNAGNVVFKDIIAQNIQKLQPEAFIVFKQKLIWLQNRSVVKVLPL